VTSPCRVTCPESSPGLFYAADEKVLFRNKERPWSRRSRGLSRCARHLIIRRLSAKQRCASP